MQIINVLKFTCRCGFNSPCWIALQRNWITQYCVTDVNISVVWNIHIKIFSFTKLKYVYETDQIKAYILNSRSRYKNSSYIFQNSIRIGKTHHVPETIFGEDRTSRTFRTVIPKGFRDCLRISWAGSLAGRIYHVNPSSTWRVCWLRRRRGRTRVAICSGFGGSNFRGVLGSVLVGSPWFACEFRDDFVGYFWPNCLFKLQNNIHVSIWSEIRNAIPAITIQKCNYDPEEQETTFGRLIIKSRNIQMILHY